MIPYQLDLETHYKGDAWEGMSIGPIVYMDGETPSSPPLPCTSCRMQFRNKTTLELGFALSSDPGEGEGTITIIDDADYTFEIPRQLLVIDAGTWEYDFETTDSDDLPTTWFKGKIKVLQDKSYG